METWTVHQNPIDIWGPVKSFHNQSPCTTNCSKALNPEMTPKYILQPALLLKSLTYNADS